MPSTISGKVTLGGKGVPGLVVALVISEHYRSTFRPTRFRSTTDEDGKYRITNVPPGTYEVTPASPTYVMTEVRKPLIVGTNETVENFDIALARGGVITGKVTDAEGRPVIEATVYVSAATDEQRLPYFRNIRTDVRGVYRAYGIPPGKYRVSAERDTQSSAVNLAGHQRTYHPSTVDSAAGFVIEVNEGTEATSVDIALGGPPRTYSARGRIIDSDTSQPVPDTSIAVQFFWQHGSSTRGKVAESTKHGEFKIENLPPGKYAVFSEPPAGSDWHSEAVPFEVTDRDVEGLLIKTSRGASVSGVVVLEGTDDPKVRANLLAGQIGGHIFGGYLGRSDPSATINPNGTFRLNGLAAGRLELRLQTSEPLQITRVERDGIAYPRGVEIKEREHVTGLRVVVGQATGSIRGVIRVPGGLELPANSRLQAVVRKTQDGTAAFYGTPVDVDARNHFRVDGLTPGTYEILVSVLTTATPDQRPIIPPARQTVVVTNGAVADVTITFQMPQPRPQ